MKLTHTFEISDVAFELLEKIQENGYAEYRDPEYESIERFRCNKRESDNLTEEQFLARNFGGTYNLIPELLKFNLVESDTMAWHSTYRITNIGQAILKQNS